MDKTISQSRRNFVKLCASAVTAIANYPSLLARADGGQRHYSSSRLLDMDGQPLSLSQLIVGETYVFHYPYAATPCFLINLGNPAKPGPILTTEDGIRYQWGGGVGPNQSVVAFSAICAHKMTHPSRSVSFINYRHSDVNFVDTNEETRRRSQVIYCCSEKSVYDPARGAQVLGGPAPQPLASIVMEYDERQNSVNATGTYGGEMFDKFFDAFAERLQIEYATSAIRAPVSDTTTVIPLSEYSDTSIQCG
ncbi:MAG: hypothetical protein OEU36_13980 [Gammaproteobacteria bacterium]|nr:hypothetical protein [Gammaproteobacteria bacterium]